MTEKSYVGYGSLISPTVIASYFTENTEEKVQEKFSEKTGYEPPEEVLSQDFLEKWRELEDELDLIPVKIQGVRRSYSYRSKRGGLMLSTRKKPGSWINAVVIQGLPEKQREILEDVESSYIREEIDIGRIETYEACDLEVEDEPVMFLADPEGEDFDVEGEINFVYHKTILAGIDLLGEIYGEEFAEEFKQDFLETTFHGGEPLAEK